MVQNQTKKCPNGSGITRSPGLVYKSVPLKYILFKIDDRNAIFIPTLICVKRLYKTV